MSTSRPAPLSTTTIGSLPHTQRELAIQLALSVDVPCLPQLPQRDPAEYMIPQALEGLPGLSFDAEGTSRVDAAAWQENRRAFEDELRRVLDGGRADVWPPSGHAWSAWRPFLWEIESRKLPFAKVQIAGPVTTRWALQTTDGRAVADEPDLDRQVLELILVRMLSMVRAMPEGTTPLVFLDEPGLFALNPADPKQKISVEELRIVIEALRKEGALVGLHCCSNTVWEVLLGLGLDYLAVDAMLSLVPLLNTGDAFDFYISGGGGLLLGIIPTNTEAGQSRIEDLVDTSVAALRQHQEGGGVAADTVLGQTLLSPACGLAMRSIPDTERILEDLRSAQRLMQTSLAA